MVVVLLYLFSCGKNPQENYDTSEPDTEGSSVFQWASRASIDLRGRRLSNDELIRLEEDPEQVESLIREMLDDPSFPEQVAWAWNERFHTAMWASQYDRFGQWEFETWQAVGWEPLAAIELLVAEERPYTDLVTMESLPLHPKTAELWGIESTQSDWHWAHPGDDRPMAGVLSSRALWMRYTGDTFNLNRQRASSLSRIFLCADFLERDGVLEFNALAESLVNIEQAIKTEPGCVSCHSALDPLGSFFSGFSELSTDLTIVPYTSYSRFNASWSTAFSPMKYFGQPGQDFSDLGVFVAADPRLTQCAVQTMMNGFIGKRPNQDEEYWSIYSQFQDSGYLLKELAYAIVSSENYKYSEPKVLRTHQLHGVLKSVANLEEGTDTEGLGPLKWSWRHRLLFGEGDDVNILKPTNSISVSNIMITEWAARLVSQKVVDEMGSESPLVELITDDSQETALLQITRWLRILHSKSVDASSPETQELLSLWIAAGGAEEPEVAYGTVMSALLMHPDMVLK